MDDPTRPGAEGPLFEEVQRFRQPWIVFLISGVSLFTFAMFGYGIYLQLFRGIPWGDAPMSDTGLIIFTACISIVMILMLVLVLRATLTVKVQASGLYLHFWPIVRRFIPWDQIESFHSVTYRPIMEYGGWGIRGFGKKMAYNVSGNRGVQLVLSGERHLLIGSKSPERLEQAIQMASGKSKVDEKTVTGTRPI